LSLLFGDRVAQLEELPQFIQCSHCRKLKEVVLFLDRSVNYHELLEIYRWLFISGFDKVAVVTNAPEIGVYEGFYEKLDFWQEDIAEFQMAHNLPPAPPLLSKNDFLRSTPNFQKIEHMDSQKISLFQQFFSKNKGTILLSFSSIELEEYIQTMILIKGQVHQVLQKEALSIYGKAFDELGLKERKEIRNGYPKLWVN